MSWAYQRVESGPSFEKSGKVWGIKMGPVHVKQLCGIFWLLLLLTTGCQIAHPMGGEIDLNRLKDGVYEGRYYQTPNNVVVRVTIRGGRMTEIKLVKHFSSWIGSRVNEIIPRRIIEKQSTRVDAVSGATNSSVVIMNAVQDAVQKAYE